MDWLYQELGIPPPALEEDSSLYSPRSGSLKLPKDNKINSSSDSSDPFLIPGPSVSTPTPCPKGKVSGTPLLTEQDRTLDYSKIYALFIRRMDEADTEGKPIEPSSIFVLERIEPTIELITWAEKTKSSLEEIKATREARIQSVYDQLEGLWKRLGVEDADIDEFVENNRGSTEAIVQSYEAELDRMLELKGERMGIFIGNARMEIEAIWDELMFSEEERTEFLPFIDGTYDCKCYNIYI